MKIKLKNNEFRKFDKFTGITKIKDKFYVYFDYANYSFDTDLGEVVGEGDTSEEALINSLKNINKRMICWAKRLQKFTEESKFDPYQAWYGNPKDKNAEKRRVGFFSIDKKTYLTDEDEYFEISDPAPNCPY